MKNYKFSHNALPRFFYPQSPAACKPFAPVKMADRAVPVIEKRLMEVKLGEIGTWVGGRDFTPNGMFSSVRKGYERYLNKYIYVKKGGIGGLSMVLAGYVLLSYVWSFDHIKHDRMRKYH